MEKTQKRLQNHIFKLWKNSSILTVISAFFLLSVFSFFLSLNHEFCQLFFTQFNSFKLFLNKKAVFCFFNAILLFIAKDSGLLASSINQQKAARSPGQDFAGNLQVSLKKKITMEENLQQIFPTKKITVEENQQLLLAKEIAVEAKEIVVEAKEIVVETKEVEKMKPALTEDYGNSEEEEDEELEKMEELGIDELNKKFEDFIERVRKEIKMGALQVVMV